MFEVRQPMLEMLPPRVQIKGNRTRDLRKTTGEETGGAWKQTISGSPQLLVLHGTRAFSGFESQWHEA
jgi:hypothetical protein